MPLIIGNGNPIQIAIAGYNPAPDTGKYLIDATFGDGTELYVLANIAVSASVAGSTLSFNLVPGSENQNQPIGYANGSPLALSVDLTGNPITVYWTWGGVKYAADLADETDTSFSASTIGVPAQTQSTQPTTTTTQALGGAPVAPATPAAAPAASSSNSALLLVGLGVAYFLLF